MSGDGLVSLKWAKVASLNPLRVRLVEEANPLDMTPRTLVQSLGVGDLVRCEFVPGRELIIVGRAEEEGSFIGEHKAGEWATSPHPAWLLPDGTVHLIADYPKLAAHYAAVYGSANFHGGNGTTTFAVPDTRERVYVNQGGSDIFAAIGAKTGAKSHAHALSEQGHARIWDDATRLRLQRIAVPAHSTQRAVTISATAQATVSGDFATALGGQTDTASTVQPSFVCRYVIRAA